MSQDQERVAETGDEEPSQGIGATNYAASAAEAGSVYSDRGPTLADTEGDAVGDPPGEPDPNDMTNDAGPSIGDVQRSGS